MGYANEVLADSPLVYLRLGDASGTTATDSSGNGRNGTYVGSPTLGVSGAISDGDDAVALNGTSQYVSIADNAAFDVSAFTVEMWVNLDTLPGSGVEALAYRLNYFSLPDAATSKWAVNVTDGGNIRFDGISSTPTNTALTSSGTIGTGAWHHIVCTYASGTMSIYIDGSFDNSTSFTIQISSDQPILLGARYTNDAETTIGNYADGTIDEFAYYSTALSPARIAAHYQAGTAVPLLSQGWGLRTPLTPLPHVVARSRLNDSSSSSSHTVPIPAHNAGDRLVLQWAHFQTSTSVDSIGTVGGDAWVDRTVALGGTRTEMRLYEIVSRSSGSDATTITVNLSNFRYATAIVYVIRDSHPTAAIQAAGHYYYSTSGLKPWPALSSTSDLWLFNVTWEESFSDLTQPSSSTFDYAIFNSSGTTTNNIARFWCGDVATTASSTPSMNQFNILDSSNGYVRAYAMAIPGA